MTEEGQPDPPPVEPNPGPLEGIPATEDLDTLLEQASSMAAELTEDVGGPDADDELQRADATLSDTDGPADGLDTQLGRMEELLDAAAAQVGKGDVSEELLDAFGENESEPASFEGEPRTEAFPGTLKDDSTTDIPEFMDDLTAPEAEVAPPVATGQEAPSITSSRAGGAEADSPPGREETPREHGTEPSGDVTMNDMASLRAAADALGDLGVDDPTVGVEVPDFDPLDTAEPASAPRHPSLKGSATESVDRNEPPPLGVLTRVRQPLSAIGLTACRCGATALERIDRPFSSISGRIKMVLGWIALATLATSLMVILLF
jgi:hypothetical protein